MLCEARGGTADYIGKDWNLVNVRRVQPGSQTILEAHGVIVSTQYVVLGFLERCANVICVTGGSWLGSEKFMMFDGCSRMVYLIRYPGLPSL
jgi:hypothetical protein